MGLDPRALPNELVRPCDHQAPVVVAGPEARQRIREDRIAGARGEQREGLGEGRVVVRAGHDQATLRRTEAVLEPVDRGLVEGAATGDAAGKRRLDALLAQ